MANKKNPKDFFKNIPKVPGYVDQEPTPITDLHGMFQKIGEITKNTRKVALDTQEVKEELIIVRTRQEDMGLRLQKIEKNGHPCKHTAEITKLNEESTEWRNDKEEGIKTRAIVDNINDEMSEIKGSNKNIFRGVIATAAGAIGSVIIAAWTLSGNFSAFEGKIEAEQRVRQVQYDVINQRFDTLPTKQDAPTKAQVEEIVDTVKSGNRCENLSEAQRERVIRQVKLGLLPPEFLCHEADEDPPQQP